MSMDEKLELIANEVIALTDYLGDRNLKMDMLMSVLISTMMTIAKQLNLPDDLLFEVLAEAQMAGKEMLANDQTVH